MVGRPALERPVLIAAFRGWNDGGQGATLAAGFLARTWSAERFADIDPEGFVDFQTNRPHVSLDDALIRKIEWPENAFYHARITGSDRDAVLLLGVEPSLRWKTFSKARARPCARARRRARRHARLAPRRRPAHARRAGHGCSERPSARGEPRAPALALRGPTGIVGVLQDACRNASTRRQPLAAVPHYVARTEPAAARALCDRLAQLSRCRSTPTELAEAEEAYAEQVTEAVSTDEETAAYVAELERRTDELDFEEPGAPSLRRHARRRADPLPARAGREGRRRGATRAVDRCNAPAAAARRGR